MNPLLLVLPGILASTPSEAPAQRPALRFVQAFYDWYTPIALKYKGNLPAFSLALAKRPMCFSEQLRLALSEDLDAQKQSPGLSIGLDGDPILQSFHPESHYQVGIATQTGNTLKINIHRVCHGIKQTDIAAIPEVEFINGKWIFVNFSLTRRLELY